MKTTLYLDTTEVLGDVTELLPVEQAVEPELVSELIYHFALGFVCATLVVGFALVLAVLTYIAVVL